MKFLLELNGEGIRQNVVTYTLWIPGPSNWGKSKEAKVMPREMLNSGVSPNVCTFSVSVLAHTQLGMVMEVEEVLDVMRERGVPYALV